MCGYAYIFYMNAAYNSITDSTHNDKDYRYRIRPCAWGMATFLSAFVRIVLQQRTSIMHSNCARATLEEWGPRGNLGILVGRWTGLDIANAKSTGAFLRMGPLGGQMLDPMRAADRDLVLAISANWAQIDLKNTFFILFLFFLWSWGYGVCLARCWGWAHAGAALAWLMNRWMWFWLDKGKSKGFQACNFGQATTHGSRHGCCHVRPVSPAHGGSRSNGFWASWQNQRQTRLYIFLFDSTVLQHLGLFYVNSCRNSWHLELLSLSKSFKLDETSLELRPGFFDGPEPRGFQLSDSQYSWPCFR